MPVRPMLLHHNVGLVSFRLFCKNLGNLQEFFRQMIYRPPPPSPWPKISLTPMVAAVVSAVAVASVVSVVRVVAVVSVVAAVVSVVAVVCVVAVVLVQ